jgi:hypothetical protein
MRILVLALSVALVGGLAASGGCDKTIRSEEKTKVRDDGTVTRDKTTVKEKPDGTIVKEREKDTNNPNR